MGKGLRAFEIDAFRGFAVVGMVIYHFLFDVRYIMAINTFAFQDEIYVNDIIRPTMTLIFVVVAGVSSCFSRNNAKRALKIFLVSLLFSGAMAAASIFFKMELYVFFNVLHLLALGTCCYAAIQLFEKRYSRKYASDTHRVDLYKKRVTVGIIIAAALLLFFGRLSTVCNGMVDGYWLLPLGILPKKPIGMGDYLPILPWMGFFFSGLAIGRIAYPARESLFPDATTTLKRITRPLEFLGRHSLLIYLLHQPILLAILFGFRYLKLL